MSFHVESQVHDGTIRSRSTSLGFTLVELLLVVSIIVLLIGILMPVLGSAKDSARQVQCANRMRHLYESVVSFSQDDMGKFPPMQRIVKGVEYSWRGILFEYTAQTAEIYDCPAENVQRYADGALDDVGKPTPNETNIWSGIGAVNAHWNQGNRKFHPPFGRWDRRYPDYGTSRAPICNWSVVEDPTQMLLFGDGNSSYDADGNLYYYQEDSFWIYKNSSVGEPGYDRSNVPTMGGGREEGLERHGGQYEANYSIADGSVRLIDSSTIPCTANQCWWDARVDPH